MTPVERALLRGAVWASAGVALGVPLLVIPQPGGDPLFPVLAHQAMLGAFGAGLAFHLAPLAGAPWPAGTHLGGAARRAAAGLLVVVVAGVSTAAVAVATAAALRFDPSLQYLQVLIGLHVSMVGAAIVLGARWRFGSPAAAAGAVLVVAAGLWTAWRYLDAVGFTPSGGWVVDGGRIRVLVLPFLAGSAVVAAAVFAAGVGAGPGPEPDVPRLPSDPGPGTF